VRPRRRSVPYQLGARLATVTPVQMIVGIAVGLAGLVLMGSSVGSTKQLELSLKADGG